MHYCSNCGKEIQNDIVYCPFCGEKLSGTNSLLREKIAEARHNETISEIGAFAGLFLIALASLFPLSGTGLFLFAGLPLLFCGAFSSFYYSRKQRKLLKEM